jgi:hypothetical protein
MGATKKNSKELEEEIEERTYQMENIVELSESLQEWMVFGQNFGASLIGAIFITHAIGLVIGGFPSLTFKNYEIITLDDFSNLYYLYLFMILILTVLGTWLQ